jgi:hypothetical protein
MLYTKAPLFGDGLTPDVIANTRAPKWPSRCPESPALLLPWPLLMWPTDLNKFVPFILGIISIPPQRMP